MSFLLFGFDWYKDYKRFQFCTVFFCTDPKEDEPEPAPLLGVFKEDKLWSIAVLGMWIQFGK